MEAATDQARPRVFVDQSMLLRPQAQPSTAILCGQREIIRRLLSEPRIRAIPFVFSDGHMFALDRTDALRLLEGSPAPEQPTATPDEPENAPIVSEEPAAPMEVAKPSWLRRVVRRVARPILRIVYALTPDAAHEDLHLVLVHSRELLKKCMRTPVPEQPQQPLRPARPPPPPRPQETIYDRCVKTGWPQAGDVLWTSGNFSEVVPLRQLAEAQGRLGFACVAMYFDSNDQECAECHPGQLEGLANECAAVDLLDVADRILCASSAARFRLLAVAARCGRDTEDARILTLGCDAPSVAPIEPPNDAAIAAAIVAHVLEIAGAQAA